MLSSYVYNRIKNIQGNGYVSPEVLDKFKREHYATVVSNLVKMFAATKIFHELQKENILAVPLKGIALLETVYKDISVRPMADIDIFVKPNGIQTTKTVLEQLGYQHLEFYRGSYNFYNPKNRVIIDMHSKFTRYEHLFQFNYEEIYERLTQIKFNEQVQVNILCPEHQIVHIALHLSPGLYSDYNLINLFDLYNLISEYPIEWEYLVEFAKRTKTASYIYAPLYLCEQLFQPGIQPSVLEQLSEKLSRRKTNYIQHHHLTTILNGGINGSKIFLQRLAWAQGFSARLNLLRMSLFPDRQEMADRYQISEQSLRLYGFYVLRLWKLLRS